MPATEQTWRDSKLRCTSSSASAALVMLGRTIWMLAKDHNREWKDWQLNVPGSGKRGRSQARIKPGRQVTFDKRNAETLEAALRVGPDRSQSIKR